MTRQLRYEGARLDDVLDRIRAEHGPDANIVSADLTRSGGLGGFFARETFQVVVELDPQPTRAATAVVAPTPAGEDVPPPPQFIPISEGTAPAAAVAPSVNPAGTPRRAASAVASAAAEAAPRRVAPGDFARMLADMIDDPDPLAAEPTPIGDLLITPPTDVAMPPTAPLAPPKVIGMAESTDMAPVGIGELLSRLSRLVRPPRPTPTDGVVAVVGPRGDAVEAAVALATAWGRAPSEVLVAAPTDPGVTPATIGMVVAESVRRREQRGQDGPTLVAVAVMPGVDGHRWAAETLGAISPAQIRLAVAGWRPVERVTQTLAGIGGVDVIDLVALDGATAPEAFLRLGVPIATVDGLPSTPALWAALLVDCGRAAALCEPEEPIVLDSSGERAASGPAPAVFPRVHVPTSDR